MSMGPTTTPEPVAGSWWAYAEGNRTLVGLVVAVIAIAAILFIVRKLWRR
jgi:hypothetical protein